MLTIDLPANNDHPSGILELEHSLVSLHEWEAFYEKAFYGKAPKSEEETLAYIRYMVVNKNPPTDYLSRLRRHNYEAINEYINAKQTATYFQESFSKSTSEVVTAELIYYWMISFKIPFTCEYWHINRLMTLIRVCGIKQSKPKRMSKAAQAEQYRRLNAERRQQMGTTG